MSARRVVALSVLTTAVAGCGLVAPAHAGQVPAGVRLAPAVGTAGGRSPYAVTRITLDRPTVTVSGLTTAEVRYSVTMTGGRAYGGDAQLRLRQVTADGRTAAPNTVGVMLRPSEDPATPDTFTGTLRVPAAVGPRLVPSGVIHPAYDDPGEICLVDLFSPDCGGMVPATGPALTVVGRHRPTLRVSTVPAVTPIPAKAPTKSVPVRFTAALVDSATGRAFVTQEKLQVVVGRRSHNDNCRYLDNRNGGVAVLSRDGTARWSMSGASQYGSPSVLDDGPLCAILLRTGADPRRLNDPIAYVDNVARITVPVTVTAPAQRRIDRSIPVRATMRTLAGKPGNVRIQRLYGRSAWRTVGVTRMRAVRGGPRYEASMRIPPKGRGTAVYRVQVFAADERHPLTTSTSATFRVR